MKRFACILWCLIILSIVMYSCKDDVNTNTKTDSVESSNTNSVALDSTNNTTINVTVDSTTNIKNINVTIPN